MWLTIRQAAEELSCSQRTVYRMLKDKRLTGRKVSLPYQVAIWQIDPLSVATLKESKNVMVKKK